MDRCDKWPKSAKEFGLEKKTARITIPWYDDIKKAPLDLMT